MSPADNRILYLSKLLIKTLLEIDKAKFGLIRNQNINSVIKQQYNIFQNRFDSRIFFGPDIKYDIPNDLEYLSLHIIRVIARLTDETKKYGNNINLRQIQESLVECCKTTKVPDWLSEKMINHLPPLFIKELTKSASNDPRHPERNKFFIYLKSGKLIECCKDELAEYYRKFKLEKFDIFIEYTDNYKILIKGNPKVFLAGKYHPFLIMSLLLQRIGKSVSYDEIYHLAIKPSEGKRPRDRSKKVYDYLKLINNAIGKEKDLSLPPEKWFMREYKKGLVRVNKRINACLIISIDKLAP